MVQGGESEDAAEKSDSWSEGLGERSPDGKVGGLLRRRAPVAGHQVGRGGRGSRAHGEGTGQWALRAQQSLGAIHPCARCPSPAVQWLHESRDVRCTSRSGGTCRVRPGVGEVRGYGTNE